MRSLRVGCPSLRQPAEIHQALLLQHSLLLPFASISDANFWLLYAGLISRLTFETVDGLLFPAILLQCTCDF